MNEYNEQAVETLDDAGCIIANKNIIIDNLQARIAELEEENARLKAAVEYAETIRVENIAYFEKQLATSQLSETQLREALQTYIDEHEECQDADDWMAMMCSMEAHHAADKALSQPSDISSLVSFVAEEVKELDEANEYHRQLARVSRDNELKVTKQRDLAVEALESCVRDDDGCIASAIRTIDTIKESKNNKAS